MGAPPRQDFQLRDQAREDAVADQTGQPLFHVQRLTYAPHVTGHVFHTDQQDAARRVGERHNGSQHPIRRGQIALELKRLAFRALEDIQKIHCSELYSEARQAVKLPSRHSE